MIFKLPTRSPRRYRGKYPYRINSVSYSKSPCQQAIADFLDIGRPVHIELNDGTRYIAPMTDIKLNSSNVGVEFVTIRTDDAPIQPLSQTAYELMLAKVKDARSPRQNDDKPLAMAS